MSIRVFIIMIFLSACSASSGDVAQSFEISAVRLAEIKNKPYTPGNGPGGFATARLSGFGDDSGPHGILFTGYGPYLHEMGFTHGMMITAIDGSGVEEIFTSRWQGLRIQNPGGFDAAHYKDLIEYIFRKQPGDHVVISVDVNAATSAMNAANYQPAVEDWRIDFQR